MSSSQKKGKASAAGSGGGGAAPIAAPIPFLQPDANGHFSVNEQAATILDSIKGKVVVVAVAGPYRTGKSYLLNRLIDASAGFAVGSTVNACTKGIWLWGSPLYDAETNTTFVFLDTEGLNSTGEEFTFDTQIFSLSVLLASVFVLNTQGTINEAALEQLELVAECSKAISFRPPAKNAAASKGKGGAADNDDDDVEEELAHHFPSLIWTLRDFSLRLVDKDGSAISPNEHLERALQPLPPHAKGSKEKNRIRRSIVSCFLQRECQPLVRPVTDEDDLQRLAELPPSALRPEFEAGVRRLRERVFGGAAVGGGAGGATPSAQLARNVKAISGRPVTGSVLVGLARAYCTAINTNKMPSILSAWQSVVELKAKTVAADAQQQLLAGFNAHFAAGEVYAEAEVRAFADAALAQALDTVTEGLMGADEAAAEVARHLETVVYETALRDALGRNAALSVTFCRDVFSQLWDDTAADAPCSHRAFTRLCAQGSAEDVSAFVARLLEAYRARARGPSAGDVERDILERLYDGALQHWAERERLAQAKLAAARDETRQAREELTAALRGQEAAQRETLVLTERVAARDSELVECKRRAAAAEAAVADARAEAAGAAAAQRAAAAEAARAGKEADALLREARALETALRGDLADALKDAERGKRQWADERTAREAAEQRAAAAEEAGERATAKLRETGSRATAASAATEELREQLAAARGEARDLKADLAAARREATSGGEAKEEVAALKARLRESSSALAAARKEAAEERAEAEAARREAEASKRDADSHRREAEASKREAEASRRDAETSKRDAAAASATAQRRLSAAQQQQYQQQHDFDDYDDGHGDADADADYGQPRPAPRVAAPPKAGGRRSSAATGFPSSQDSAGSGSGWEQPMVSSVISPVRAPGRGSLGGAGGKRAGSPLARPGRVSFSGAGRGANDDDDDDDEDGAQKTEEHPLAVLARLGLPGTAEPVRDPTKLKVQEIRSWLTSIDVLDHQNVKGKAELIALLKKSDPRLK